MNPLDRAALRGGVALVDRGAGGVLRVTGPGAWDALDRLLPCDLRLRDGQGRQTLLVAPDGAAEADVVVVSDGDDLWLVFDGVTPEDLADRVRSGGAEVVDPGLTRLELSGPFSWELAAKLLGPSLVGLPYLELRPGAVRCLRGGRTGEYGYELLVPEAELSALRERLANEGAAVELREVPRSAADDAALENAFWIPARPGLAGLDPLELQLQWRLSWDKPWPGSEVLRARRADGPRRRSTAFRAPAAAPGAPVLLDGEAVGEVRVVLDDPEGGPGVVGYALLDARLAHPGLPGLTCGGGPLVTVSPPFLLNLSLFVKPQRHRYANRHEVRRP